MHLWLLGLLEGYCRGPPATAGWLTDWLTDRPDEAPTNWLIERPANWLIDQTDRPTERSTHWQTDLLTDWLTVRSTDWLTLTCYHYTVRNSFTIHNCKIWVAKSDEVGSLLECWGMSTGEQLPTFSGRLLRKATTVYQSLWPNIPKVLTLQPVRYYSFLHDVVGFYGTWIFHHYLRSVSVLRITLCRSILISYLSFWPFGL
jgi:hypothetical protein